MTRGAACAYFPAGRTGTARPGGNGRHAPVSPTLALLTIAYLKRGGIPSPLWNPDLSKTDVIQQATVKLMAFQARQGGLTYISPSEARMRAEAPRGLAAGYLP